jgi:hypothetical protein
MAIFPLASLLSGKVSACSTSLAKRKSHTYNVSARVIEVWRVLEGEGTLKNMNAKIMKIMVLLNI